MAIRIGINPLTWTHDNLPELGADVSLETCLAEARQAGYAGMELGSNFPRAPEKLRPVMKKAGLDVVTGWYSSNLLARSIEAEKDALEPHLHLLYSMGCRVLVLCETTGAVHANRKAPLSTRPKLSDPQWKQLCEGLDALGVHIQSRGMTLAYHHHMGTVVQTSEEIDRLMTSTGPDVGLLLDTGHITFAGGDPVATAKKHAARLVHVHTKDVRKDVLAKALAGDWPFLDAVLEGVFTVPGDGMVDYPGVFDRLAEARYSGWLVVDAEQDPKKANPLKYATLGFQNVAKYAADAKMKQAVRG